jgi:photosystem I P700 chlorophyll a apoprotein A2
LGSGTISVNEYSASGFFFWARSVGFVTPAQALAFGVVLEGAALGCVMLGSGSFSPSGLPLPFGLTVSALSLLWSGHLAWSTSAAAMSEGAASPARLLSLAVELSPTSHSILLTDIIHHHCAIAGIVLWGSYTNFLVPTLSFLTVPALGSVGLNRQVSVACFGAASVVFWTAHQGLSLPSAAFIHFSLLSSNALYAHHLWIASALMVGAFVHLSHGAMLNPLYGAAGLLSHLSWIALFLGFHTLGIYVHNDAVYAFGAPEKAQMIQPIFVQAIQSYAASKFVVFFQWLWVLCPADFLVYHALGLGVHTVALIFLQGAFGCAGSILYVDKRQHGFGFACDGPGRGGTCDISGWDSVYLGVFWVLNTLGWLSFYEHWRSLVSFDGFCASGSTLCGWFRDYLWLNSGNLVNGFSFTGSTELAVLAWAFLLGHLIWATSFMFLISWRGYWQELVESLLFIHLKTPGRLIWRTGKTSIGLDTILNQRGLGVLSFLAAIGQKAPSVLGVCFFHEASRPFGHTSWQRCSDKIDEAGWRRLQD